MLDLARRPARHRRAEAERMMHRVGLDPPHHAVRIKDRAAYLSDEARRRGLEERARLTVPAPGRPGVHHAGEHPFHGKERQRHRAFGQGERVRRLVVARMAPGAVLLRAHDVEQVPSGENPSRAVHHHIGADGAGALALRGAAGDDHRRVKPAAMGTALLNILSAPSMHGARERARRGPRAFAPASGVPSAASCPPSGTGAVRPSPSATPSRADGRHCERRVRGVADHYNQPRSRKAERSTPGGANQPPAPYLAPSFNATSLLPYPPPPSPPSPPPAAPGPALTGSPGPPP